MRTLILAVPLLLAGAPALAQPAPPPLQVPPQLMDPQMTDRLVTMGQVLSDALLNLPVGDIQAAAEGRPSTWADRHRTIRDLAREDDPSFDRNYQRGMAEAGPKLRAAHRAVVSALPQVMGDLSRAVDDVNRAMQNMPRPEYPQP
jgi:hypothetical protein